MSRYVSLLLVKLGLTESTAAPKADEDDDIPPPNLLKHLRERGISVIIHPNL